MSNENQPVSVRLTGRFRLEPVDIIINGDAEVTDDPSVGHDDNDDVKSSATSFIVTAQHDVNEWLTPEAREYAEKRASEVIEEHEQSDRLNLKGYDATGRLVLNHEQKYPLEHWVDTLKKGKLGKAFHQLNCISLRDKEYNYASYDVRDEASTISVNGERFEVMHTADEVKQAIMHAMSTGESIDLHDLDALTQTQKEVIDRIIDEDFKADVEKYSREGYPTMEVTYFAI